jgi:hypothetical protein
MPLQGLGIENPVRSQRPKALSNSALSARLKACPDTIRPDTNGRTVLRPELMLSSDRRRLIERL